MNTSSETWQPGGQSVQLSHLEKVYWPQTGFAKGDLLRHYRQIAPVLLEHSRSLLPPVQEVLPRIAAAEK